MMLKKILTAGLAIAMALCLCLPATAEESVEERLEALETRIAELEERVAELEAREPPEWQDAAEPGPDPGEAPEDDGGDEVLREVAGRDGFMVVEPTVEDFKDYFDFTLISWDTQFDLFSGDVTDRCATCGFVNLAAQQGWHAWYTSDDFAVRIRCSTTQDGDSGEWTVDLDSVTADWRFFGFDSFAVDHFEVEQVRGYVIFASEDRVEISEDEYDDGHEFAPGIRTIFVNVDLENSGYGCQENIRVPEDR